MKNNGRWWPFWGALAFASLSVVSTVLEYRRLAERHSWTAATVTLAFGAALALAAGWLGAALGRALRRAATADTLSERRRWLLAAVAISAFVLFFVMRTRAVRAREARLDAIRAETLTPERARALAAGDPEERGAVAYNPSCPPEILESLASSPDQNVRAGVGGNPSTPARVASELSRSGDEIVRYYTTFSRSLPLADLEVLARDPSPEVSRSASASLVRRKASAP